jgi:hypothetical protein
VVTASAARPEQLGARDQEITPGKDRQVLGRKSIRNRPDASPMHLADAHRTRFTTRDNKHAAADLIGRQQPDGHGHQIRFGVGGRITIGGHLSLCQSGVTAVDNENGAEWMVACQSRLAGQDRSPVARTLRRHCSIGGSRIEVS